LLEVAEKAGVRTPNGAAIESWQALLAWIEANGLPAYLKADHTHGGNGVIEIRSVEDAKTAWKRLSAPPSPLEAAKCLIKEQDLARLGAMVMRRRRVISVQRAIDGHAANCIAVCKNGELLAYIGVEVDATIKPTGFGTVIQHSGNGDMRHAAATLARELRLSGVFGLDFVIKPGAAEAYLIEMNPRLTPLGHFHFGAGRDPAAALCAIVSNDLSRRERAGAAPAEPIAVFPHMLTQAPVGALPLMFDLPLDQPELLRLSIPLPSNPIELASELISRFLL
jgi:carbamoyl-phosphate synthase L subunit-like protein